MRGRTVGTVPPRALRDSAVEATLRTVTSLTGMELAFVAGLTDTEHTLHRVLPSQAAAPWPEFVEGGVLPRADSLCDTVLRTGPYSSADVPADPSLRGAGERSGLGAVSYVGVPVPDADGGVFGTLCGVDRAGIGVGARVLEGLCELAGVVAARLAEGAPALVRSPEGWRVTGLPADEAAVDDLLSGMVLADLLAAELREHTAGRPPRADPPIDEVERLRLSVTQLEHALAARVVVEQAIGVLAERRRVAPRAAFETLRGVARGSGRRVHDLAQDVVASVSPSGRAPLPGPLRRPGGAVASPAAVAQVLRAAPGGPPRPPS